MSSENDKDIDLGDVLLRPASGSPAEAKAPEPPFPPIEEDEPPARAAAPPVAPLAPRARAFAADALICVLLAGGSLLAAAGSAGVGPGSPAAIWTAAFAALLSFFLAVPALALFGKTPGMALADLSAEDAYGEKPTLSAAARRWLGTLGTLALAGLPLLTLLRSARETPADILSGRPLLAVRGEPSR